MTLDDLITYIRYARSIISEIAQVTIYTLSSIALLALGLLSFSTLGYASWVASQHIAVPILSIQGFYQLTELLVKNEVDWGAFVVLVANLSFISKRITQSTQKRMAHIQEERWDYEKEKVMDEHYAYKSKKRMDHPLASLNPTGIKNFTPGRFSSDSNPLQPYDPLKTQGNKSNVL